MSIPQTYHATFRHALQVTSWIKSRVVTLALWYGCSWYVILGKPKHFLWAKNNHFVLLKREKKKRLWSEPFFSLAFPHAHPPSQFNHLPNKNILSRQQSGPFTSSWFKVYQWALAWKFNSPPSIRVVSLPFTPRKIPVSKDWVVWGSLLCPGVLVDPRLWIKGFNLGFFLFVLFCFLANPVDFYLVW